MTDRPAAIVVLIVALALFPLTILGVVTAIRSNANDVRDWLPAHYDETRQYDWFHEQFGGEDFVIVSWPGCTLDDPRLDRVAEGLEARNEASEKRGDGSLFRRVTTGRELLERLTSDPVDLDPQSVVARLKGTLVGPDGKQTCAVVTLRDRAQTGLHATLAEIRAAAADVGLDAADVHLGGPAVVNAAIDESSTRSLVRLAGLAALIGLVIAWLCFRTVRLTLIVFIVAGYSAALSLAVVPLCGVPLNAILVTMVPLVYVAAMSGAIHLSNYYLASCREGHTSDAIRRAVRHAVLPLGLATATTAAGLLSLYYSDLAPIRLFGIFSAIGVGIGLLLQVMLLPALLTLWPAGKEVAAMKDSAGDDEIEPLSPRWQRLARVVIRRHAWLAVIFLAALALGCRGLARMETSIQIMRLFSRDTPIIASYAWLEKNLGALVPLEVVIRFDKAIDRPMADRLRLVRKLHDDIAATEPVGGCLSAATFTPQISETGASLRGFLVNRQLRQARPLLAEAGYLVENKQEELWRISVRVSAGEDLDYGLFQEEVRRRVEPLLAEARKKGHPRVSAIYTGAVPIIFKARRSLLDGLILGFGTDVALVVVAVIVLLRHWSSGLLLLLTSVFPMALIFGSMGWLGIVVDIGSVMTPCVALGVTIDDVIHFVLWFRRGIARGLSVPSSVELAYAGCGRAMVQSWGVIGLGLAAFALSSFIPTFRFGALMIGLLTVGLAGNLLFLPSLLAGPLGQIIAASVRRQSLVASSSAIRPDSEPAGL